MTFVPEDYWEMKQHSSNGSMLDPFATDWTPWGSPDSRGSICVLEFEASDNANALDSPASRSITFSPSWSRNVGSMTGFDQNHSITHYPEAEQNHPTMAGCTTAQRFSRFFVQVASHLEVSQALFDNELKGYFFRMLRAQAGHDTKKIYIRVPHKNCVSEEAIMKKLSSSGIGPFMEVEGIPYRSLLYSMTNEFFRPRAMKGHDEMLRIPVQNLEAGATVLGMNRDKFATSMTSIFQQYDADHSGFLDPQEFEAAMRNCGIPFNDTQIRMLMAATDLNEDGLVEYGEFANIAVQLMEYVQREEQIHNAMGTIDE